MFERRMNPPKPNNSFSDFSLNRIEGEDVNFVFNRKRLTFLNEIFLNDNLWFDWSVLHLYGLFTIVCFEPFVEFNS